VRFSVVLADPPWAYRGASSLQAGHLTGSEGETYATTKSENLHDVGRHLARVTESDSILFCWVTGPTLAEGVALMTSWGYPFSQVAFVWEKQTGNPGAYTHTSCEFVLVGRRGRIPSPYKPASVRQFYQSKRGDHSQKPEEIQSRVEAMFPGHTFLELFARRTRSPWVCIGNEITGRDIRDDLDTLAVGAALTEHPERRAPIWKRQQLPLF
jgi:N6-adenosine-specific RNA methylase IME4